MEFYTAEEVAEILQCSPWFVYQHRELLGGIKIGKLVRFEKQIFEAKIKEVMENGGLQASREMDVRLLEEQSETHERRVQHKAGSKKRRSRSKKKGKADEFGLHKFMREQT